MISISAPDGRSPEDSRSDDYDAAEFGREVQSDWYDEEKMTHRLEREENERS